MIPPLPGSFKVNRSINFAFEYPSIITVTADAILGKDGFKCSKGRALSFLKSRLRLGPVM